ncbi:MAG: hypothetical protein ACYTBJ_25330 [Planctomycetota bacterium]|jgi:hypothetical protein
MTEQIQLEQAIRQEIPGLTPEQYVDVVGRVQWERAKADRRVAAEREACALTLEKEIAYLRKLQGATAPYVGTALTQTAIEVVEKMAATIRARGEEGK